MLRLILSPLKTIIVISLRAMGYDIVKRRGGVKNKPRLRLADIDNLDEVRSSQKLRSGALTEESNYSASGFPENPSQRPDAPVSQIRTKNPSLRPYRISMHHVGGRGGGFPFPLNPRFLSSVETYIYDADADCLEHMEHASKTINHVIAAAVAGADGRVAFHVNYDPYTSSLRSANPLRKELFYQDATCDYILEDVLRPVKVIETSAESLDSLAAKHDFKVDYLSLDVQGAEYDLLAGISDATLNDTVAIMCEISLFQFYDGQKLFEDISVLLREKGFFVARFFPHGHDWSTFRADIGWRGSGFTAHGDVLFFRWSEHIAEHAPNPFLALLKLAFISISYDDVAYALQCLTEAYKRPDADVLALASEVPYIRFLDDMFHMYRKTPHIYPARFSHIWSAEKSSARFSVAGYPTVDPAEIRGAYFGENDAAVFQERIPYLLDSGPTPFESFLRTYGFTELADRVVERRILSAKQVLGTLGLDV